MADLLGLIHTVDLEHELQERASIRYETQPDTWALWEGLRVQSWASRYDRAGEPERWSLCDLIGLVVTPYAQTSGGKDGLSLWSPTQYGDGASRGARGVEAVSMLVLDVDDGTDGSELLEPGALCLAHTSWSHLRGEEPVQKWRVIYPLASPVPAAEWSSVWRWAGSRWPVDPATKDASRMFYVPAVPRKAKRWERIESHSGEAAYRVSNGVYELRIQWGETLEPGRKEPARARLRRPRTFGAVPALVGAGRRSRFVAAVMADRIERIEQAGQGQRNTRVFCGAKDAGKLEAAGALVWAEWEPRLLAAGEVAGLSERETQAAISSGRKRGANEPWTFGD